jgi:hypothetical protein
MLARRVACSSSHSLTGTDVELRGSATNTDFDISLDGVITQPNVSVPTSMLAAFYGLPNAQHTISLTVRARENSTHPLLLAFYTAAVTLRPPPGRYALFRLA